MPNFETKNFTSSPDYVALLWVQAIEHVIFEINFSQNRFLAVPTPVVKKRIAESLAKKNIVINNYKEIIPESSAITLVLLPPALLPPVWLPPTQPLAVSALHETLKDKTINQTF